MAKIIVTMLFTLLSLFVVGLAWVLLIVGSWRGEGTLHPLWAFVVALGFCVSQFAVWRFWWASLRMGGYGAE